MPRPQKKIDVYFEKGQKRTFAGAADWPGWCRAGRDEESALQALLDYGPRYQQVLRASRLGAVYASQSPKWKSPSQIQSSPTRPRT